ncbi:hypothetical protein BZA77DRAFT_160841 [Pyronema omphalodes]|nr:hypothetical protein BZA77DRAFT_160841 [Pyronema omphalodes]
MPRKNKCWKCGSFNHKATNKNCPRSQKAKKKFSNRESSDSEQNQGNLPYPQQSLYLPPMRLNPPGHNSMNTQFGESDQEIGDPNESESERDSLRSHEHGGSEERGMSFMPNCSADGFNKRERRRIINDFIRSIKRNRNYQRSIVLPRPWENHPSTASGSRAVSSNRYRSHRRHPYADSDQRYAVDHSAGTHFRTNNTTTNEAMSHGGPEEVSTPRLGPMVSGFLPQQLSEHQENLRPMVSGFLPHQLSENRENLRPMVSGFLPHQLSENQENLQPMVSGFLPHQLFDEADDVDVGVNDNEDVYDRESSDDESERIVFAFAPSRPSFQTEREFMEWADRPENNPLLNTHWHTPFNYLGPRNQVTEPHRITYGRGHQGWRECRSMGTGLGNPFPL